MLVVELRDSGAWRIAASAVVTVPPENNGKLIIDGASRRPNPMITRVGSGRDSTLANNSNAGRSRGSAGVPRPSKGDVRRSCRDHG